MASILETIGLTLGAIVILGALLAGYVGWRRRRRTQDDEPDARALRGGGPGDPVGPP